MNGYTVQLYVHHRIHCSPRTWKSTATKIATSYLFNESEYGVKLYGIWRSQIGLPRDAITVITLWPDAKTVSNTAGKLFRNIETIQAIEENFMVPTVRPTSNTSPIKQGNYAFRWFETPKQNFDEFIQLCVEAWPDFEKNYDSEIIGLWRLDKEANTNGNISTLMLTRRPNLAVWEKSKIPVTDEEKQVRRKLSKRYDLCDWTTVYTTTLITAVDVSDEVRWS